MTAASRVDGRATLLRRMHKARAETDCLFDIVRRDSLYDRPIAERHRIVFYIGHLEAFDWNLLSKPLKLNSSYPDYDHRFAFGIDPVDGGLPVDDPSDWPPLQLVHEYRDRIREKLDQALQKGDSADQDQLLNIAIE